MIRVDVKLSPQEATVTVVGHANYAPRGFDIVCAAMSMNWETLIASLQKLSASKNQIQERDDGGVSLFVCTPDREARTLLLSFVIGAQSLANAYPKNVIVQACIDAKR